MSSGRGTKPTDKTFYVPIVESRLELVEHLYDAMGLFRKKARSLGKARISYQTRVPTWFNLGTADITALLCIRGIMFADGFIVSERLCTGRFS